MPFKLELLDTSESSGMVLHWRRSSLEIGHGQSNPNNCGQLVTTSNGAPRFPMEILEKIVKFIVADAHESFSRMAYKEIIGPCSLASKGLRYLALRFFSRHLRLYDVAQARVLLDFLAQVGYGYQKQGCMAGYVWVRSMRSPLPVIPAIIEDLAMLTNLETINVDVDDMKPMFQCTHIDNLFASFRKAEMAANIGSLTLKTVPRVDTQLLTFVAQQLPRLIQLQIFSANAIEMECCVNCYKDSLSTISHSPIPDVFCDTSSLGHAFGRALAPLSKLSKLFLGLYLSPSDLLGQHIHHGQAGVRCTHICKREDISVYSVYDCFSCHDYKRVTKENELLATHILAGYLASVKTISWNACFTYRSYHGRFLMEENVMDGSIDCRLDATYGDIGNGCPFYVAERPSDWYDEGKTEFTVHKTTTNIWVVRVL
ncbi:hypothetical protein D9613_005569 [Agrocybe pediades]|uniref:Uncharacterized protein n=1 Tax=Agrocybe pediades TaxID=84607 RepID=A0A8H4QXQ5_9AGAR|nr:hypothetical protein D9613_005569 [Agrocybe pediades]